MRQSLQFTRTRREAPKDEVSANAKLLARAGFVEKLMAGVYSFLPYGLRVVKKIESIIREEMNAIGGQEVLLPVLHPRENWEKTGRWESYDSLFRFKSFYSKNDYALGPTHEEIVVPLVRHQNLSYKDFPVYIYQIQDKFRDEPRAKSGLLRGREFIMKDLYSFHLDEDDLNDYYERVKKSYFKVFERAGLGDRTHLTFASGGTFSKYSHEFQTLADSGEDTIYLCASCGTGLNKEIAGDSPKCPECGSSDLEEKNAIEVGNIFKLKAKYSSPFGLAVKDESGAEREVIMGCYGIGINRLMGAIVEVHNDERGIVWPESVAPFAVHLLKIGSGGEENNFAENVYKKLKGAGVEVLYDDREVSAGEKFADTDLIGIPYRAVVSEKTGERVEIKRRDNDKVELIKVDELVKIISNS